MIKPGGTRIATSAARDRVQAQHKAAGLARDALYLLRADTQMALADPTAAPNAVYRYCAAFGSRPNALLSRARSAATHNGLETSARGHLSGGTSNLRFGSNPAGFVSYPTNDRCQRKGVIRQAAAQGRFANLLPAHSWSGYMQHRITAKSATCRSASASVIVASWVEPVDRPGHHHPDVELAPHCISGADRGMLRR